MTDAVRHDKVLPRLRRGLTDPVNQFNVSVMRGRAVRLFGRVSVFCWGTHAKDRFALDGVARALRRTLNGDTQWILGRTNPMLAVLAADRPIGERELVLSLLEDPRGNLPIICDLLGSYGSCWADPFLEAYSGFPYLNMYTEFDRTLVVGDRCSVHRPYDRGHGRVEIEPRFHDCLLTGVSLRQIRYRAVHRSATPIVYGRERRTDLYTFAASNWRTPHASS